MRRSPLLRLLHRDPWLILVPRRPNLSEIVDLAAARALAEQTLTSELSIRYLRPARGLAIHARAELLDVGRRSIVGSMLAWTDSFDKPVAIAQGTYVRPRIQ